MFGRTVSGFGSRAKRGEAAPSSLLIQDAAGNDNRFTTTIGATVAHDNDFSNPYVVAGLAGSTITFGFYSQVVGNVNSWQWSVLNINDPAGVIASYSSTPSSGSITGPTTVNWTNLSITLAGSIGGGSMAEFQVRVVATNSGGSDTADYTLTFLMP